MASYNIVPKPSVEKDLRSPPKSMIARVVAHFEKLADDPFPRQALKPELPLICSESELGITESSTKLTVKRSR